MRQIIQKKFGDDYNQLKITLGKTYKSVETQLCPLANSYV